MQYFVYTIYDKKVNSYSPPFFVVHPQQAIRSLTQTVNDSESQIKQFPEDFALYSLGTYDDATGLFTQNTTPQFICEANSLITLGVYGKE